MTMIRPGAIALFAAMLLIGCSGDSPTAPPSNGGGGTPPPNGANVTLEVSNNNPLVNSTSTITAVVMQNGTPVPDGTAVEFSTTFGSFVVGQSTAPQVVKTTTNGRATVSLTSTAAGQAVVTARVNNSSAKTEIVFKQQPVDPTPGDPQPTITSVNPQTGPPDGGTVVTLRGQNFEGPVRVLFGTREAVVASVTSTELRVISPKVALDAGEETREVPITVIFEAGTAGEVSAQAPSPFRYELEALTPQVIGVTPSSGPNEGGTLVSIIGSGFQAPVRVFFGAPGQQVEAQVQQVTFNQITALTPKASGLGAALANTEVPIRVVNMATGKEVVTTPVFRYGPAMVITAFSPGAGTAAGGQEVTIFGWGFDDPVSVSIGGVGAFPIKVSGTEIVAVTGASPTFCSNSTGPVRVTNIEDASTATSPTTYQYLGVTPTITAITPNSGTLGSTIQVSVRNSPGGLSFNIGGVTRLAIDSALTANNVTVYTVALPTTVALLDTEACGNGGERYVPTAVDLQVDSSVPGCSFDTLSGAITLIPSDTSCRNEDPAASASRSSIAFGNQGVGAGATAPQTFTVTNAGGGTLRVTGATSSDPQFTVSGTFPANLSSGQSTSPISVTFDPNAVGTQTGTITVSTSAGSVTVAVSGNGT